MRHCDGAVEPHIHIALHRGDIELARVDSECARLLRIENALLEHSGVIILPTHILNIDLSHILNLLNQESCERWLLEWNDSGTYRKLGIELDGAHHSLLLVDLGLRHLDAHI